VQPVEILLNRVFTKENTTSSLRKSSSPFFLQEFRPLTPLKATYRFTSLTVIRVTKIMCNKPAFVSMQSSAETTHVIGSDESLDHVVLHHIQPMVE
jgi:hypothetical protein